VELRVGAAGAEAGARLPAAHEEALYRLAQEALANVVKHARTTRAVATLVRDATVRLLVEDDGVGFGAPAPAFSYGLAGMRERVEALYGALQLETRPGGGARVLTHRHAQARRDQRSNPPPRQRRSSRVESREPPGRGGPLL